MFTVMAGVWVETLRTITLALTVPTPDSSIRRSNRGGGPGMAVVGIRMVLGPGRCTATLRTGTPYSMPPASGADGA
jgi:hypothetical protein